MGMGKSSTSLKCRSCADKFAFVLWAQNVLSYFCIPSKALRV